MTHVKPHTHEGAIKTLEEWAVITNGRWAAESEMLQWGQNRGQGGQPPGTGVFVCAQALCMIIRLPSSRGRRTNRSSLNYV